MQCNCSGKRSDRSTYSRERIFCMGFGGRGGVPGNWAKGAMLTDAEVAVDIRATSVIKQSATS